MERVALRVRPRERGRTVFVRGAQHVVVDQQVGVAEVFCRLGEVANRDRVVAQVAGRKHGTELQAGPPDLLPLRRAGARYLPSNFASSFLAIAA